MSWWRYRWQENAFGLLVLSLHVWGLTRPKRVDSRFNYCITNEFEHHWVENLTKLNFSSWVMSIFKHNLTE
ncbi:unnamed protein product [Blepharisma stoltei]|uniref:Secreted protein n=1 Tax=Blepharisma stoltei TaxID=1481888 RepID=A0AAU9IW73_9CILI|nr:unnamed protein product [Blepharisma stoltei]